MNTPILRLLVDLQLGVAGIAERARRDDRGQSTAEYALVLAAIATLVAFLFKLDLFQDLFTKAADKLSKTIG